MSKEEQGNIIDARDRFRRHGLLGRLFPKNTSREQLESDRVRHSYFHRVQPVGQERFLQKIRDQNKIIPFPVKPVEDKM